MTENWWSFQWFHEIWTIVTYITFVPCGRFWHSFELFIHIWIRILTYKLCTVVVPRSDFSGARANDWKLMIILMIRTCIHLFHVTDFNTFSSCLYIPILRFLLKSVAVSCFSGTRKNDWKLMIISMISWGLNFCHIYSICFMRRVLALCWAVHTHLNVQGANEPPGVVNEQNKVCVSWHRCEFQPEESG